MRYLFTSISEIMKANQPKRCLLQSKLSSGPTFFIPWFFWEPANVWYGIQRWVGNNNRSIQMVTRCADRKIWRVKKQTYPILQKNHSTRIALERKEKRCEGYTK